MAGEAMIEAARQRAADAENAVRDRVLRLTPTLQRRDPEGLNAVLYVNSIIDGQTSGRLNREDADIALLRKRRDEILAVAERNASTEGSTS